MLDALIFQVDDKTRNFRAISNYIQSDEFNKIYSKLSDKNKSEIVHVALEGDFQKLKDKLKSFDLSIKTVRELRDMAKFRCIPGYQSMDKDTLLEKLV